MHGLTPPRRTRYRVSPFNEAQPLQVPHASGRYAPTQETSNNRHAERVRQETRPVLRRWRSIPKEFLGSQNIPRRINPA